MPVTDIEIFTGLISLFRDETYQLEWSVLPEDATNKEVSFLVDDPTICTISDTGLVTAIGSGKTSITITSVSNPTINKTFYVASTVRVETVTLTEHELHLEIGDTHTIPVSTAPEDATDSRLTWECWNWDNPCITINSETGLITAIADGEDTVFVSAKSNVMANDQCSVRVWTDMQSVSVYPNVINLGLEQSSNITHRTYPKNASNPKITITVQDPTVASYEAGVVKGLAPGKTIITFTSVDNPELSAICQVNVYDSKEPEESDYNSTDRIIQWKADIYFDGLTKEPVSITRDNYLMNADLLEETHADSASPFGSVSSNEIDMTLLNNDGRFSPTKKDSPYYGKIKKGVPIHLFCRPSDQSYVTWDELGWFYVTDWTATVTGITATIAASDKLYNIFDRPAVKMPVRANISFAEAYQEFFDLLGEQADIDKSLVSKLLYSYNVLSNQGYLTAISTGAQAHTFCGRDGKPKVQYSRGVQEVKHTLTDNDQIISISSKQSASLEYDGTEVVLNTPQESNIESILSVKSLVVPIDGYVSEATSFTKKPIVKVTAANLTGEDNIRIKSIAATCLDVIYEVQNETGKEVTNALEILGTYLEIISTAYTDAGDNLLSVDNEYIQTEEYAKKFKLLLKAYVSNRVPILELDIRGNPKYLLGEKLHIISERYSVDFEGILIRQNFHYDGSMFSSITLLNSEIMEVM